jgi:hypothetical protein
MPGKPEPDFPVRGTPGGWKDAWDSPDDADKLRAQVEEAARQADARAEALRPAPKDAHQGDTRKPSHPWRPLPT